MTRDELKQLRPGDVIMLDASWSVSSQPYSLRTNDQTNWLDEVTIAFIIASKHEIPIVNLFIMTSNLVGWIAVLSDRERPDIMVLT